MRKATTLLTILASVLFYAFAFSSPASADPNSPGNNGTVKIHRFGTPVEDMRNEPHVCTFYVDGFKFDDLSTGQWWIVSWSPTGDGTLVKREDWNANGSGNWHSGTETLPPGHYKLYAKQQHEITPGGNKQKVFWVECPPPSTNGGNDNGGNGNNGGDNGNNGGDNGNNGGDNGNNGGDNGNNGGTNGGDNGNNGGTNGGGNGGTNGGGNGGGNGGTNTDNGNGNGGTNGGTTGGGTAVRGFESAPNGNAIGSVTPIVELPGRSNQQSSNGTQAGFETSPLAGVQSLPSTSTTSAPAVPLAALGLAIMALGGVLLRRRSSQV